ncbi:MAG: response regulator transcription factor [Acidimicrobiaceae bacterium]|nr:response regulator transcription factor [Acidimicrobiaceae bacterium]MBT5851934.1 response regulator transcription factor [Acidimicrobiaceae bacterium]
MGGWAWKGASDIDAARRDEPANGWVGAIVVAGSQPEEAFRFCRAIRSGDVNVDSVLLLIGGGQLGSLDFREDVFDDFCLYPFHPVELEARLKHQFRRSGRVARAEVIEYGALAMNLETYQALIAGKPLDLTYMEYELLKFLASHPGKVFTRETLLSRVWGYDYYGGARTVDVHVRRLRAKLGEEHANLIQTVRSVGYSFGASRWA